MYQTSSESIILRDFTINDLEAVQVFAGDPEVTRYLSWGPNTQQQTRQFLELAMANAAETPRRNFELAIVDKPSSSLAGSCGLLGREPGVYEIGICLAKQYWGQGVGTESIQLLVRFAFDELQAKKIIARMEPENTVSVHLFGKQGFVFDIENTSETLIGILTTDSTGTHNATK